MTKEDKELLLRDLCARLPHGVKVKTWYDKPLITDVYSVNRYTFVVCISDKDEDAKVYLDNVKPYLRPMSSMTEEEVEEYETLVGRDENVAEYIFVDRHESDQDCLCGYVDWLNSHHFDYRGLIEKGLALESPEGMYNKEQPEKGSEVPIPKTVDEAVKTLAKVVSKEDRDYLLENGAISVHDSMGRWIRNEWGLWTDSELKNELKKKGFEHPDDMSNYVIEEFIKYCNNKL